MKLTKEQKKELQSLTDDIMSEAKEVRLDYERKPSEMSGSVVRVHENSPYLDSIDDKEPQFSGSRWTKVLKSTM